jgi:hypothetical protein
MAMVPEAMTAVAAMGGAAVVQAAGTDAWTGVRAWVARWLGRGNEEQERTELSRLDAAAAVLQAVVGMDTVAEERRRQEEAHWTDRFRTLLEELSPEEFGQVEAGLRALLDNRAAARRSGGVNVVRDNTFSGSGPVQIGNDNVQHNHGFPERTT